MKCPDYLNPTDQVKFHPLCEAIDEMTPEEFSHRMELYQDHPELIDKDTVVMTQHKNQWVILDGRHTRRIAQMIEKPVKVTQFEGSDEDALVFVRGRNLDRRHMNANRRAICLVELYRAIGIDKTNTELAKEANASMPTIDRAKKVIDTENDGLIRAVKDGEIGLYTAEVAIDAGVPEDAIERALANEEDKGKALRNEIDQHDSEARARSRGGDAMRKKRGQLQENPANPPKDGRRERKSKASGPVPCPCVLDTNMALHPTMYKNDDGKQIVKDAYGWIAPDCCGDKFGDGVMVSLIQQVQNLRTTLQKLHKELEHAIGQDNYGWIELKPIRELEKNIVNDLSDYIEEMKDGLPYAICPKCSGMGKIAKKGEAKYDGKHCIACRGTMYWPLSEVNKGDNYKLFRKNDSQ